MVLVLYNNGLNGKCDINCASGSYYDKLSLSCKPCSSNCINCIDSKTCLTCDNTKFLYQSQCIDSCPSGFVGITTSLDKTCQKCPVNCLQCSYNQNNGLINCN